MNKRLTQLDELTIPRTENGDLRDIDYGRLVVDVIGLATVDELETALTEVLDKDQAKTIARLLAPMLFDATLAEELDGGGV